jgi:AAA+ ATPase superfamily predicted ATPase
MGTVFEKVCKQFLLLNRDRLPFTITKLGRWWHKDKEIDVVALNEESKEICFFECKYSALKFKDALDLIAELKNKSGYVDWNTSKRKENFGMIAKKIADKERLRKEGYFVFDFDDF